MNVITPLNHRVIVEPEARKTESKGGIIIPNTANQKAPTKGTVISIAPDADIKLKISAGDVVLFPTYAGTEIIIPAGIGKTDRRLQIIKEEDILAVIRTE